MTETAQDAPSGVDTSEPWPEVKKIPGADQEAAQAAGVVAQEAAEPGRHAPLFTAPGVDKPEPKPARAGALVCAARECRAEIYKPLTEKGRHMPVDVDPNPAGNLVWRQADYGTGRLEWRMHAIGKGEHVDPGERRFMPHWKTCTSPEAFRRREKREKPEAPAVALLDEVGLDPEVVRAAPTGPRVVQLPPPGPTADVITFVTREVAPTLAELGATQPEADRTCSSCGAVAAAVMPTLWGNAPTLLDREAGMYELLAVHVANEWRVRLVGDTEQGLPYWNRRAAHRCPIHTKTCQTPGHENAPASLTAAGAFCPACLTSRQAGSDRTGPGVGGP